MDEEEKTYYCTECHSYFHEPDFYDDSNDPYHDPWSNGVPVCPECGSEHFNEV